MVHFRERLIQTLRDLKVPIGQIVVCNGEDCELLSELEGIKILMRLITDCIPDHRLNLELKAALSNERSRRQAYEKRVDMVRDELERILCDIPTKNEMIRALERLMSDTSPEQDWSK